MKKEVKGYSEMAYYILASGFVQFSGETYHLISENVNFPRPLFFKGHNKYWLLKDSDQTSAYHLSKQVLKIGIIKFT